MKKWPSSLAPPTSTSLRIVTKRKWFRERWPMRWVRGRRSFRLRIGTRLNYWTTAGARWCPSKILKRSQIRPSNCWILLPSACMRKRAYTFARDMVWKRVAQGYMETFVRVRSDRMEYPRVQFSARATPKALDRLPELKLDHVNALTDDTGMLQHAIFTIPNRGEGHTPTTTRARLSSRCCWRIRRELAIKMSTGKQIHGLRISLPVICRSSSTHSIQRPAGFETFSAMIAGGTSR